MQSIGMIEKFGPIVCVSSQKENSFSPSSVKHRPGPSPSKIRIVPNLQQEESSESPGSTSEE